MSVDLLFELLAEHLLVVLLLSLMVLEMFKASPRLAGVLLSLTLFAACTGLIGQYSGGEGMRPVVPGEIRVDLFAVTAKEVLLGCTLLWSLAFRSSLTFKAAFLVASSALGGLLVLDSAGFIPLFIGIELLSLPAFALMVHGVGETSAAEGAFKYLLLSCVASAMLLLGIALSYGATGTLAIDTFAQGLGGPFLERTAAGLLVLCGLLFKAAVFPFHGWAPDAYGGSTMPVTALLASVTKGAVVLALVRVFGDAVLHSAIVAVVVTLSILSIFYGNLTAVRQQRFRRLLAYSSIAHAGYMLLALADTTGSRGENLLWYVAIYSAVVVVACAGFAALCPEGRDEVGGLDGAFQARPGAALLFGLAMLSLAGLPPLPGFFAKLLIFRSVIASGHLTVACIAFAGSFIGFTYYAGLFFRLFASAPWSADARGTSGLPLGD
ncbi:MAG TPA: proton-conducting transporter membrane subunit [Steroidobacteraceae bacterium]